MTTWREWKRERRRWWIKGLALNFAIGCVEALLILGIAAIVRAC